MDIPLAGSVHLSLPMLLLLGKATLILLAALAITRLMPRASAGARHLVWLVTLGTLLLVPAMTAWGPVRLAVLPERASDNESRVASNSTAENESRVAIEPTDDQESPVTSKTENARAGNGVVATPPAAADAGSAWLLITRYSVLCWSAVLLAILASLAWSGLTVRRIVRQASPLEHDDWRTPLYEVADRLGLADAPRLLKSDEARMPFACGIVTPTIVLPAECEGWSLDRRRAVLLHELAHVRRHDLLGHTLGRLACAVYWFHPLVWTAARQLRAESERACDDLALSCGTRATDYAEHLLEIVTSVRKDATPSVALAMARRKEFEGRMLAILDPELRHSAPSRRQAATLIGSLALVALTIGAVSPVAATATPAPPPAEPAQVATPVQPTTPTPAATAMLGDTALRATPRREPTPEEEAEADAQELASLRGVSSTVMREVQRAIASTVAGSVSAAASASASSEVRAALRGLASETTLKSGDERTRLLAKILASDTSASLRRVAAWGLQEYTEQPGAIEALATALRRDSDASVREMAAWALGNAGDRSSAGSDALVAALKSDADEKVRATAAWALGEAGDRGAVDALVAALSSPSATIRSRALWAIGSIEPKEAPRAVMTLLRDPDTRVRRLAAWTLFQIEDPAALGALQEALKVEPDKDVQIGIIRAIGTLGDHSVEALKGLVESSDPRLRSMAVRALAGGDATGPWPWPWPQPRPFP